MLEHLSLESFVGIKVVVLLGGSEVALSTNELDPLNPDYWLSFCDGAYTLVADKATGEAVFRTAIAIISSVLGKSFNLATSTTNESFAVREDAMPKFVAPV